MPIRPPALDDRGFDDLVGEMLRRIPAHTPEWTNPRVGDPGRTLIDLVAWLGDTILYRANLIPERQRLAFLRLLGVPMRPAQPARGLISIAFDKAEFTGFAECPKYTRIAKPVPFETEQDVTVLPVTAECFIKRSPSKEEEKQFAALLPDLLSLYGQSGKQPAPYVTTAVFAKGGAEPAGRDIVAESADGCLWIGLVAATPELRAEVKTTLGAGKDGRRQVINIGVSPAIVAPLSFDDIGVRRAIPHRWEICSNTTANDEPRYAKLDVLFDSTLGLTKAGIARLNLPGAEDFGAPPNDVLQALSAGVGDRPPRIDDAQLAARLVTWIRLRPEPGTALKSLKLAWVGINAVTIEQRETAPERRTLGQGTGASDQEYSLGASSVEAETLVVEIADEGDLPRPWRRVADTAAANRDEPVFSLDSEAGLIRFGDGVRGRAPAAGSIVQAHNLRIGGGSAGNLQPGSIKDIVAPAGVTENLKVNQPLATAGGSDAERLEDAERRIPRLLRNRDRAVTATDFKEIALRTPGIAVGRVEVLPRFKPHQTREDVPGAVSVMCLPGRDDTEHPAPRPDRPFLETAHAWLDERRPLATELYVIGCEYIPLAVSVAVELTDPSRRETILNAVSAAVKAWLWALAPGGPAGDGWPLGRSVSDREIEVAVARVSGVASVAPVLLFEKRGGSPEWSMIARDAKDRAFLNLARWQLPELLAVVASEGSDAEAGGAALSGGAAGLPSVAVPVVPEVC